MTESSSGSFPLIPRILFGIFALGSIITVISVAVLSKGRWEGFVEDLRQVLTAYPVVEERIGRITSIELDRESKDSKGRDGEVVILLRGTMEIGMITVEVLKGAHGESIAVGNTLKLSSGEVLPLVRADAPPPGTP